MTEATDLDLGLDEVVPVTIEVMEANNRLVDALRELLMAPGVIDSLEAAAPYETKLLISAFARINH